MNLIVDVQSLRAGIPAGVIPAAGEPGVVGSGDVGGQRIPYRQRVFGAGSRDAGKDIVVIGPGWFGCSGVFGDERIGDEIGKRTAPQTVPLHRGYRVGDDVQPVPAADKRSADIFRMGKRIDTFLSGNPDCRQRHPA